MEEGLLEGIGLTKGEAKIYLTLLKLGQTTTGKIVDEAQISSGKVYETLNKLIKKGLVSYIIKEKTKHFSAASPNRILDYLHEKEGYLKKKEAGIISNLPSLLSIEKSGEKKYEVNLFLGFKGFQSGIFEALNKISSKDEVLAMGVSSSKDEKYNRTWKKWHSGRINKGIKCKMIFSDRGTLYFNYYKKLKLTEIKVNESITPTSIDILGEIVLILTYGEEPSCLYIKNREIAQSLRSFFNSLWITSKR